MPLVKGEATRRRILDVTAQLLQDVAVEDVSIAEITRRASVTRPGFYFHFPSKGAAVASLMEDLFDDFVEAGEVWYGHGLDESPEAAFRLGLERTVDLWREHAVLMRAMTASAAEDEHARLIWNAWVENFSLRAVPRLRMDMTADLSDHGIAIEDVARTLVGMVFEAMRRDVESIALTGSPVPRLVESIWFVWTRAVYRA